MKKLLSLLLTVLSLVFLSSCDVEDQTLQSLTLDKETLDLAIDETYQFVVTYNPTNLKDLVLVWTTSNKDIVNVDPKGRIKAVFPGQATITVSNLEKTIEYSCVVTVLPTLASSISLNMNSVELFVDENVKLTYKIKPDDTTNKEVIWSSEDINIATVDNEGTVVALGEGQTNITVTTNNLISDVCVVKVNPIKATSISLNKKSLSMEISDQQTLIVNFIPQNTTNKKITWKSSDPDVATVSETGEIIAIAEGITVVTATSDDGGFSADCNITVKLKGIVLSKTTMEALPGQKELISVNYSTSDTPYNDATWSSSNSTVAKVTGEYGTNSALIETGSIGTAIITATAADGVKTATCHVVVKEITDFMSLSVITSGIFNNNGFITGDVYSQITNNSPEPILLTSFYMYDSNSGALVGYSTNPDMLGTLASGESKNLGKKLNSVYYPIFEWNFTWNENTYKVVHMYQKTSWFVTPQKNMQLNLIAK